MVRNFGDLITSPTHAYDGSPKIDVFREGKPSQFRRHVGSVLKNGKVDGNDPQSPLRCRPSEIRLQQRPNGRPGGANSGRSNGADDWNGVGKLNKAEESVTCGSKNKSSLSRV